MPPSAPQFAYFRLAVEVAARATASLARNPLLLVLLALALPGQTSWSTPLKASREILLPAFQAAALSKDLPATAVALQGEHTLWLAGKTSLWRWDLHQKRLTAVRLGADGAASSQALLVDQLHLAGNFLFASSPEGLYQITIKPLQVFRYDRPPGAGTANLGLMMAGSSLLWAQQHGLYKVHPHTHSLSMHKAYGPLPATPSGLLLSEDSNHLWLTQGNQLLALDLSLAEPQLQLRYETRYPFTGLGRHGQQLLVHTRHTLLLFAGDGELTRTIPVEGSRRLVSMHLTPSYHDYLFHDRLFERHDLKKQQSSYSYLALGRVQKAGPMVTAGSLVALILDGKPRVFQLEGQWSGQ